jgi:gliding motility-associated-like protein
MDSYNWSTGETSESIFTNEPEVSLEVIDINGCSAEASTTITSQSPNADFIVLPDTVFTPGTILSFSDLSEPGLFNLESWMWNFGNGDISNSQNPDYAYEESGIFTVTLIVTDEIGCEDASTQHVFSTFEFTVPEGFSPNGDGINDEFEILGLETIDGTQVQIFNRWGTVVFESSNYKPGNFWDGDNLPDGTYFYIITLPNEEAISGDITIAR